MRMGARRSRPAVASMLGAWCAAGLLVALGASTLAQPGAPGLLPTPTPAPTPTATPQPTPAPTASPAPDPTPEPGGPFPPLPGQTPEPTTSPSPDPDGEAEPGESAGPEVGESLLGGPPGFEVPRIARTPGRNTIGLIRLLEPVTQIGISLEEALLEATGRFPVAGHAWYSDDWALPRWDPYPRLHQGLDIFADFGTPIRAPDAGVITRMVEGPIGGIALWMRARDGVQYYFAHLEDYASGMEVGRTVETGTVIGYVGDTGNARGGPPHLHFEIHKPDAVPPKPYVDQWLEDAMEAAPAWVDQKIREVLAKRKLLRTEQSLAGLLSVDRFEPSATPEYSLLLTLLDPVGGSVGMLPRLPLVPAQDPPVSDRLLQEFIRLRVDGAILPALVYGLGSGG